MSITRPAYEDRAGSWSDSFLAEIAYHVIHPLEGTIGTEFTLRDENLGVKKGKVLINGVAQNVLTWREHEVTCLFNKPMRIGAHPVAVIPKGGPPFSLQDPFIVKGPEIDSISPGGGKP